MHAMVTLGSRMMACIGFLGSPLMLHTEAGAYLQQIALCSTCCQRHSMPVNAEEPALCTHVSRVAGWVRLQEGGSSSSSSRGQLVSRERQMGTCTACGHVA
jgi:hypothetical protein